MNDKRRAVSMSGTMINGWRVSCRVDDDGHRNVYVENTDGTDIREFETGQGDGTNGEQYAVRFTTERIEREYHEEMGDDV